MIRNRSLFISMLVLLLAFMFTSPPTRAADADEIIKNIQKKYKSAKTVRIQFKETALYKLTNTMTEVSGTLQMEGEAKFRLDSEDQVIVNDGKNVWRYNKLNNQVLIDYAKKTEQDVMLSNFLYEIKDHYFGQIIEEKKEGGVKKYAIKLTPRPNEQSFFTSVKIWVQDKTWEIEEVVYTDYNGNETTYIIEKIEFNPNFTTAVFSFTPPEGIQVVDLRF